MNEKRQNVEKSKSQNGHEGTKAHRHGGFAKRCVLAYSGGLDTTTIVVWLAQQGYEIHAVLVDVGQDEDLPALCEKALRLGAKTAIVADARPAMEAVLPYIIGLGATYEGNYRLGTALARPFIALEQVKLAKKLGGATLVHGATGKGNDQIRFEYAYRSLAPECPVLAPWKVWDLAGRSDMIAYLKANGVEESFEVTKTFSMDENLWHLSVEGGDLEDPLADLDVEAVLGHVADKFAGGSGQWPLSDQKKSKNGQAAASSATQAIELSFIDGTPIALNGEGMELRELVEKLNRAYRSAPWAWDVVIENRCTGIKSRGLYINPAAKVLAAAMDGLARCCLNKTTYDYYAQLGRDYGAMIYRGEYFSDQRLMLEAAGRSVLSRLNGDVRVRLEPVPHVARVAAADSLFSKHGATFEKSDFAHSDAAGFIHLTWLGQVGRSFEEDGHGKHVAAGDGASSEFCDTEPVSERGLVPAAV
jgi:argininosuccinate synthase